VAFFCSDFLFLSLAFLLGPTFFRLSIALLAFFLEVVVRFVVVVFSSSPFFYCRSLVCCCPSSFDLFLCFLFLFSCFLFRRFASEFVSSFVLTIPSYSLVFVFFFIFFFFVVLVRVLSFGCLSFAAFFGFWFFFFL